MLRFFCLSPGHISLVFLSPQDILGGGGVVLVFFPLFLKLFWGYSKRRFEVVSEGVCVGHHAGLPGANSRWISVEQTAGNAGLGRWGCRFYSVSKVY